MSCMIHPMSGHKMFVIEKTHRIEVSVRGRGAEKIAAAIKAAYPAAEFREEEELEMWETTDIARKIKARKTPGKLLRAYRDRAGMTSTELAAAAGIDRPNLTAMENDRRTIGLDTAKKLGRALGVSYTKFVD